GPNQHPSPILATPSIPKLWTMKSLLRLARGAIRTLVKVLIKVSIRLVPKKLYFTFAYHFFIQYPFRYALKHSFRWNEESTTLRWSRINSTSSNMVLLLFSPLSIPSAPLSHRLCDCTILKRFWSLARKER